MTTITGLSFMNEECRDEIKEVLTKYSEKEYKTYLSKYDNPVFSKEEFIFLKKEYWNVDDLSIHIIQEYYDNPWITRKEVAKKFKTSPTTVSNRISFLIELGVMQRGNSRSHIIINVNELRRICREVSY